MTFSFDSALRSLYVNRFSKHHQVVVRDKSLTPAAVAIVLVPSAFNNEICFLLTRRSTTLARHSGQYALPGGRLEPGENVLNAALRELKEEIGLAADVDQIIGTLDDFPTRSGFCITPIVIWFNQKLDIVLDSNEVEELFSIPVRELSHQHTPTLHHISQSPNPVLSLWFKSLGEEVFAPTAAVLYQFREIALFGRTTSVSNIEQPVFAWQ